MKQADRHLELDLVDLAAGAVRRPSPADNANDEFTCQADPVRRKYTGMPQFTQLVGGGYFFLPGIKALRFIAGRP